MKDLLMTIRTGPPIMTGSFHGNFSASSRPFVSPASFVTSIDGESVVIFPLKCNFRTKIGHVYNPYGEMKYSFIKH